MVNIYKDNCDLYRNMGLIPVPAIRKAPIVKWGEAGLVDFVSDDFGKWKEDYPDANIWALLGDEFVVIDPDGPAAEEFVQSLDLPEGPVSISGGKSRHRWFKTTLPIKPLKVKMNDGSFLEVRTGRLGLLVPPSIHPETKKAYQWDEGHSLWEISFPEFPIEAYERIKAFEQKHGPQPGSRPSEDPLLGSLDVKRYLDFYGIRYQIKKEPNRTIYALGRCLFADQHSGKDSRGDSAIIQGADGKVCYQCFHNHCAGKTWQDARKAISGGASIDHFFRRNNELKPGEESENNFKRAILDADELRVINFPEKKKILFPWLSEQSLVLVAGWRGVGKTWFALGLADAITRGSNFGPWKTVTPAACLYIDGEMDLRDIKDRMETLELSAEQERRESLLVYSDCHASTLGLPKLNLKDQECRTSIKNACPNWNIKLVILDNLPSLCPGIDENSKQEWDPVNQWLIDLRFKGVSVIMLHHNKKDGGQRGTSGREDNIDISISLVHPADYTIEDGARFVAKFSKARIRNADLGLIADTEFLLKERGGRLVWTFSGTKKKNKVEVLRLLAQGIKQKEIHERLGLTPGRVSQIKQNLIEEGLMTKSNQLTPMGQELLHED